jgi:2-phospho-L-lactate/phosphoenolpyruvate guanylyltransferase
VSSPLTDDDAELGVSLVVPVKTLSTAKSRLHPDAAVRRGLALAFAKDTLNAARACPDVNQILVVTADPNVASELSAFCSRVVAESEEVQGDSLANAIDCGLAIAVSRAGTRSVAILPSDLPALVPADLSRALRRAARHPLAFVPDAEGIGTTLLVARDGRGMRHRFGRQSAALHHRTGAVALAGPFGGLRCDVDTLRDLRDAIELGVGRYTTSTLAALSEGAPALQL